MPCAYVVEYLDKNEKTVMLKVGYADDFEKSRWRGLKSKSGKKFTFNKCVKRITIPCENKEHGFFIESLLRLHYSNHGGILEGNDHFTNISFDAAPLTEKFYSTLDTLLNNGTIKSEQEKSVDFWKKQATFYNDQFNNLLENQQVLIKALSNMKDNTQLVKKLESLPTSKIKKINKWLKKFSKNA